MLGRLLANEELAAGRATALHPGITDPAAVAECFAAGPGATVRLSVGGGISRGTADHAAPCELTGEVVALRRDDPGGGDLAAVRRGGVTAILVSRRKPFHTPADFGELDPRGYDPSNPSSSKGYSPSVQGFKARRSVLRPRVQGRSPW